LRLIELSEFQRVQERGKEEHVIERIKNISLIGTGIRIVEKIPFSLQKVFSETKRNSSEITRYTALSVRV